MTPEQETQVEKATTAWRRRAPDGSIQVSPAWADLSADERRVAFDATVTQRAMEAALHPQGLSTTGLAVLARIRGGRG